VAIPVLNEESYIGGVLDSFLNGTWERDNLEILVADGGSTDRTTTIVKEYASRFPQIRLMSNPKKLQVYALNLMLTEAKGDLFLRADAHSLYASDYVEQCVRSLQRTGALNVGGAQRFVAHSRIQAAIALATWTWLGTGGASYKKQGFSGFADTVYLGCYVTDALRAIGGFNELLWTNEDAEVNARLRAYREKAVFIDARIRVSYFPRTSIGALIRQYFRYGKGRALTTILRFPVIDWRGTIPFLVLLCWLIAFLVEWLAAGKPEISAAVALTYLAVSFIEALRLAIFRWADLRTEIWVDESRPSPGFLTLIIPVWLAIASSPLSHASGFGVQVIRKCLRRQGF
jgi:glycosyltransferase involved in cell wall biosynthesis